MRAQDSANAKQSADAKAAKQAQKQAEKLPEDQHDLLFSSDHQVSGAGTELPPSWPLNIPFPLSKVTMLPQGPRVWQPKLRIHSVNDRYEQEADRIAERVVQSSAPTGQLRRKCEKSGVEEPIQLVTPQIIQRKCAKCEEEEQVQMKTAGGTTSRTVTPSFQQQLRESLGRGQSLSSTTRAFMEHGIGADFGQVRLHTDTRAAQLSQSIQARVFTFGQDIFFNRGEFKPGTQEGQKLIAHELVHTVQQGGGIYRKAATPDPGSPSTPARGQLIVSDNSTPVAGQMRKTAFLQTLQEQVCATVNQELQDTDYTSDNCPYIKRVFARQADSSAAYLEQLISRYQPDAAAAQSASELATLIMNRVRVAVNRWKQNGNLNEVPEPIAELTRGLMASSPEEDAPVMSKADVSLQFKANPGGAKLAGSPQQVMEQLGRGRPLESRARSTMEKALG